VHAALSELTPLRQKIIVQAFFRGLTHAEIADSMRMSLGTVKSHLRRGLCAMRGILESPAASPAG
jgi:RNA polymerase sigma-70 factor (ECF subfamily)